MKKYRILMIVYFLTLALQAQEKVKSVVSSSPKGVTIMIYDQPLSSKSTANVFIGYYILKINLRNKKAKLISKKPLEIAENWADLMGKKNVDAMKEHFNTDEAGVFQEFLKGDSVLTTLALLDTKIGEGLGLVYHDENVDEGKKYGYAVIKTKTVLKSAPDLSFTKADQQDFYYHEVTVGKPLEKLHSPTGLTAEADTNKITLKFDTDAGQIRYVYRSEDSLGTYLQVNKIKLMSSEASVKDMFIDRTVKSATKYYYTIANSDIFRNEAYSDTISVIVPSPDPIMNPTWDSIFSVRNGVELHWKPENELSKIAGYEILRRNDMKKGENMMAETEEMFQVITPQMLPLNDTTYVDNTARIGTEYRYKIRVVGKDNITKSASLTKNFMHTSLFPPLPPKNITTEPMKKAVKILWEERDTADIYGYMIARGFADEARRQTISAFIEKGITSFVDTTAGLSPKNTYAYYIKTFDVTQKESPYSKPVYASPLGEQKKPRRMNSLVGNYSEFQGNKLKWGLPQDKAIQEIELYRTPIFDTTKWELVYTESVIEGEYNFRDTTRNPKQGYYYKMCAVSSEKIKSDFSNWVKIEPQIPDVFPPNGLTIQKKEDGFEIRWLPMVNPHLKSYAVYRRTYTKATEKVADIPQGTYRFLDKVQEADVYYYYVASVNSEGKEGNASKEVVYQLK